MKNPDPENMSRSGFPSVGLIAINPRALKALPVSLVGVLAEIAPSATLAY
jgi:hypothetical protein